MPPSFNNLWLKVEWPEIVVSRIAPPFESAYWPDIRKICTELGLPQPRGGDTRSQDWQYHFAKELACKVERCLAFYPGVESRSAGMREIIRRHESARDEYVALMFIGRPSRQVVYRGLEFGHRFRPEMQCLEVQLPYWGDPRDEDYAFWEEAVQQIRQAYGINWVSIVISVGLNCHDLDAMIRMCNNSIFRLRWVSEELASCQSQDALEEAVNTHATFARLATLSERGILPEVVLPVTRRNLSNLLGIVECLFDLTRAGKITLDPISLLARTDADKQSNIVEEYASQLMALRRSSHLLFARIFPFSWIMDRIEGVVPPGNSYANADIAVLPNGEAFMGENWIGNPEGFLGDVCDHDDTFGFELLRWKYEVDSSARMRECVSCPWCYRCGGVGPDVTGALLSRNARESICTVRKTLFEHELFAYVRAHCLMSLSDVTQLASSESVEGNLIPAPGVVQG